MMGFIRWIAGIPSEAPVDLSISQSRIFAAIFIRRMARQVLMTMTWVRRGATVIMLGAMSTTFEHQQTFILSKGGTVLLSIAIPLGLDSLTFMCVKVLATWAVKTSGKITAALALCFSISMSGTLNYWGSVNDVLQVAYVVAVVMIAVAEIVAATVKPDFRKMAVLEDMLRPPEAATVPAPESIETPITVASEPIPQASPEVPTVAPQEEPDAEEQPETTAKPPRSPRRRRASMAGWSYPTPREVDVIEATVVETDSTRAVVPAFYGPAVVDPEADMG